MFWRKKTATVEKDAKPAAPAIPRRYVALWEKVSKFQFDDPGAEFPMSKRLAEEQGWTHELALRVIEEFRRFMFMCTISEKMCTPSLMVDEVWHISLIYTDVYWIKLCVRTLGTLIHHEPAKGGTADKEKFNEFYITTLELYATLFGEPPEDIWGTDQRVRRKPAACAAVRASIPKVPASQDDRDLLFEIEKAAARLKQYAE